MARERVKNACGILQGNLPRRTAFDCVQVPRSQHATGHRLIKPKKKGFREGVGTARKPIFGGELCRLPPPFNPPRRAKHRNIYGDQRCPSLLIPKDKKPSRFANQFSRVQPVQRTGQSLVKGVSLF